MQPIFNNPVFSGKPRNIYGKSFKWYTCDREATYDPYGNLYGPDDIDYTFNKNGFRCDDFKESDVRIVFLGCSITEAIGVRYTEGWAYQILDRIRKDTNLEIPYWNLSMGGCGLDAIIRAYYHYHDILKPHIVLAFLPGYRREIFIPEDDTTTIPLFLYPGDDKIYKHEILIDPRNIHYETEKNLAMLDLMLKKYNTTIFWNSWGYDYPRSLHNKSNLIIEWDMKGRDKMHPGPDAHQKFAREFYSKIKSSILEKIHLVKHRT